MCGKCSRANPDDAAYCYFDGVALPSAGGQAKNGGPVRAGGARQFNKQFVFPSGKVCMNFDELAMACQGEWTAAVEMLKQGYLEQFMIGLGRADLGLAAREAAKFPDRDRGLDQFLAKLPSDVLQPPRLRVEPREINLGQLKLGEDRQISVTLENQGMRLIYGTATVENTPWLSLGPPPGKPQKMFKFGKDQTLQVNVLGKHLRASSKPLEGKIVIESNAGVVVITVKAEVTAKPFPSGVLAGARSPRQIAEKAKANPKEAAALFEKGLVAQWYKENGWPYPVRGATSSGLGAIQQFFEALGLTPPPKVDVNEKAVNLTAHVGAPALRHQLQVQSQEKRPVWAYATSDQPWLEVGKAVLNGRVASIPMTVPRIPNRPGETLHAKVRITANGNQRFIIPVTLRIGERFGFVAGGGAGGGRIAVNPALARRHSSPALALLPLLALAASLLLIVIWDVLDGSGGSYQQAAAVPEEFKKKETPPPILLNKDMDDDDSNLLDSRPRLIVRFSEEKARVGVVLADERDPNNPAKFKRLTYQEDGSNNNCVIKIDNHEYLFGNPAPGFWVRDERRQQMKKVVLKENRRWKSVMEWPEGVRVTRLVRLIGGEQTRLLDTCLITYEIENRSDLRRTVGIREMLDTFIGANDGTPFAIPGLPGLVDTMKEIPQKDIPQFIQALETGDPSKPGTVAVLGCKIRGLEPMLRLVICHWPDEIGSEVRWQWKYRAMNNPPENKDSCLVMYWPEMDMAPKEKRRVGYTWGLGAITGLKQEEGTTQGGDPTGKLALTVFGPMRKGKEFTVLAYVKNPTSNQAVELTLPKGLSFAANETAEKRVTPDRQLPYTQVSWRVRADEAGDYLISKQNPVQGDLKERGNKIAHAEHDVRIGTGSSVFD
jgi:hypothetical protein